MLLQCFDRILHLPAFYAQVLFVAQSLIVMLSRHMTLENPLQATAEFTGLTPQLLGFVPLTSRTTTRITFRTWAAARSPPINIVTIVIESITGILPSDGLIGDVATAVWIPVRVALCVVFIFNDLVFADTGVTVLAQRIVVIHIGSGVRLGCGVHLFSDDDLDFLLLFRTVS